MTLAHICPTPGCGKLTQGGRCQTCQKHFRRNTTPAVSARKEARRKQDGRNTTQWQRIRKQVLDRDGWECQICGEPATHAHYHPGGDHTQDLDQYTSLCRVCHGRHHGNHQHRRPTLTTGWMG